MVAVGGLTRKAAKRSRYSIDPKKMRRNQLARN